MNRLGLNLNDKKIHMFSRTVRLQLKPNSGAEFTRIVEKELIPLLRKQPKAARFQGRNHVHPLGRQRSRRDQPVGEIKENAETYETATYPEVLRMVAGVVEGTPRVNTSEVSNSTCHRIAAQ